MKQIIYILIISIFFACQTTKRHMEEQQQARLTTISELQRWQQQSNTDSTKRYWSVRTDSLFYFHPDKGLWAQGGWLYAEEQAWRTEQQQSAIQQRDSLMAEQVVKRSALETLKKKTFSWYVYAAFVLIVVIACWRVFKKV